MDKVEVKSKVLHMGKDLVILVENENSHIGSVVVAFPYIKNGSVSSTYNVINTLCHNDDLIAIKYATRISRMNNCVVTCICGIHYDDFSEVVLKKVCDYVEDDIQKIEDALFNHNNKNR